MHCNIGNCMKNQHMCKNVMYRGGVLLECMYAAVESQPTTYVLNKMQEEMR